MLAMSYLYRLILILMITAALLGLPLPVMAEPLNTLLGSTNIDTTQIRNEKFSQSVMDKVQSGNYRGAIEAFTRAIHLNSHDAKAYGNRGLVRAALGDRQGAIADFNQALRLNPELATAYYNRGFIRSELQDYQGALADFSQAIRLNPQDAAAHQCRCLVRYTLGKDMQGVMEDFHTAAALYLQKGKLEEYLSLVNGIKKLQQSSSFSLS